MFGYRDHLPPGARRCHLLLSWGISKLSGWQPPMRGSENLTRRSASGALPTSWIVWRRLKLIFARISTADAPGVPLDLSQCGVERGVRPLPYAGHSFRGVALRMDHELTGSACRDAPHRAAEEVRGRISQRLVSVRKAHRRYRSPSVRGRRNTRR